MKNLITTAFLVLLPLFAEGQTGDQQRQYEAQKQETRRTLSDQIGRSDAFNRMTADKTANAPIKKANYSPPPVKLSSEQKKRLKPDAQDLNTYKSFLDSPKTGLIKLFADFGCAENSHIVRADEKCLKRIPNSEFYSFRKDEYTIENLADIRYKNGFFISDSLLTQGLMTSLGDIPLEKVSLSDNWVQSLNAYQPEAQNRLADAQSKKITKGVKLGDNIYRNALQILENNTYVLRSIAYRGSFYVPFQGRLINLLSDDTRKDIIVAFRIVRKNPDDSLTILWKELSRKDAPKIVYQKKTKNKSGD